MQTLTCPVMIGKFKRSDYGQNFISARKVQLEYLRDSLEFAPSNLIPRIKADIKRVEEWLSKFEKVTL